MIDDSCKKAIFQYQLINKKIVKPQTVTLSQLAQELRPFIHKYLIKVAKTMNIEIKIADDFILVRDADRIRNYMRKLYEKA